MALIHQSKICSTCSIQFSPKKGVSYRQWNKSFWCSRECYSKSIIGRTLTQGHKHKISSGNMGRIVTEVTKLKISKGNKGKVRTEETLKRLSLVKSGLPSPFKGVKKPNQTGSKHWKWIQDRTKVRVGERILNDPLQKGWCKAVKNRDSWKCRIANSECKGRLEAHHILTWKEHPELRYEVNNGITLCHHHHPRKKEDVVKLSPYFKQLVATLD